MKKYTIIIGEAQPKSDMKEGRSLSIGREIDIEDALQRLRAAGAGDLQNAEVSEAVQRIAHFAALQRQHLDYP